MESKLMLILNFQFNSLSYLKMACYILHVLDNINLWKYDRPDLS